MTLILPRTTAALGTLATIALDDAKSQRSVLFNTLTQLRTRFSSTVRPHGQSFILLSRLL